MQELSELPLEPLVAAVEREERMAREDAGTSPARRGLGVTTHSLVRVHRRVARSSRCSGPLSTVPSLAREPRGSRRPLAPLHVRAMRTVSQGHLLRLRQDGASAPGACVPTARPNGLDTPTPATRVCLQCDDDNCDRRIAPSRSGHLVCPVTGLVYQMVRPAAPPVCRRRDLTRVWTGAATGLSSGAGFPERAGRRGRGRRLQGRTRGAQAEARARGGNGPCSQAAANRARRGRGTELAPLRAEDDADPASPLPRRCACRARARSGDLIAPRSSVASNTSSH